MFECYLREFLIFQSIHFLWAILTLCLSSGHCEVFVGFCEILSSASDYVGLYLIDGRKFFSQNHVFIVFFQLMRSW